MTDALKPCPFCGGPATRLDGNYDFGGEWFETGCDNVGCRVLPSVKTLSREHADEGWNTRADTATPAPATPLDDPRVKALVEAANGVVNEYYNQVHGPAIYNIKHLDAALSALEGKE